MTHRTLTCLGLAVLGVATASRADIPASLVDPALEREAIHLLGVEEGRVRYFDARQRLRTASTDEVIRLSFDREMSHGGTYLTLADGQVLRGRFKGATSEGKIRWANPVLGKIELSLKKVAVLPCAKRKVLDERLRKIMRPRRWGTRSTPGSDIVELRNGDRLTGFLERVSPRGPTMERDGQTIDLAWNVVAMVRLANPRARPAGSWVTLVDGSRLRVDGLSVDTEKARGTVLGGRSLSVKTDRVSRLDFTEAYRVVGLHRVVRSVERGGKLFGVRFPPRFGADGFRLHAPVSIRFEVPPEAVRFSAKAVLAKGSRLGGDLVVRVRDGEGTLVEERLHGDRPRVRINTEVRGSPLYLDVDEGKHGPVLDRLRLRDPVLLVKRQ